jgi:hypothetical protein
MRNDINIREIQDADYDRIADFHSTFPDDNLSSDEWKNLLKFWWDQNPAYSKGYPRGAVALKDNKVIGFTGNIPTRMLWSGKEILVSNGTTWRVLPMYRKISMVISDKNNELTRGFVKFNTTANELVQKLLVIYKWSQFTCAEDFYYYLGNSQSVSKPKIYHIIAILQKIFAAPLNSLFMMLPKKVFIRADVNDTMLKEVDKLWRLHKDEFQFTNVRDSRYVNWVSKLKTKTIYSIYYENEMKGFVILSTYLNTYKEKSIMLVDYWCPDLANYAKPILNFLLRNYKDYNLAIPAYNQKFRKAAMSCLLIKRNKSQDLDFIHFGKEKPIEYDKSFLTMMQGNRSLLLSNSG